LVEELWYGEPPTSDQQDCDFRFDMCGCVFYDEMTEEDLALQEERDKRRREDSRKAEKFYRSLQPSWEDLHRPFTI
jgi:hypothetical protein